ncbi:MAG: MFS transporter [Candidatus Izemoplasmatales bacterium]|nr:MFS transporter [Candidatus Izemoplasmatales bacterium]
MVARVWDAIIDPLIGHIFDKTKSKMGKRRIFLGPCFSTCLNLNAKIVPNLPFYIDRNVQIYENVQIINLKWKINSYRPRWFMSVSI